MKYKSTKIGFVIGNGESRRQVALEELSLIPNSVTYGCNALYRDFKPSVLVARDCSMKKEIQSEKYSGVAAFQHATQDVVIYSDTRYYQIPSFIKLAGVLATYLICVAENVSKVFLLGFDPYGDGSGQVSNMYKGTKNYQPEGVKSSGMLSSTVSTLHRVIALFPMTSFYRVGDIDDKFPENWYGCRNLKMIDYKTFDIMVGTITL